MKGQNPSQTKASELESPEAELLEQGLQALARIIARVYVRDIELKGEVNREPDHEILPRPRDHRSGDRDS